MVDSLVGSYKFEKNENFESFLSATGVPFIPRKMMVSVSPSVNISKDGEVWTVTFNVLFKSFSIQFELGKTFVEDNPVSKEINKVNTRSNNTLGVISICSLAFVNSSAQDASIFKVSHPSIFKRRS